jgi:hypothetical protein
MQKSKVNPLMGKRFVFATWMFIYDDNQTSYIWWDACFTDWFKIAVKINDPDFYKKIWNL